MNAFFLWAMRSAAAILFGMAIFIAAGIIAYHLFMYIETARSVDSGSMAMSPPLSMSHFVFSALTALSGAALPLFGAAIIWRIDRWLASDSRKDEG